MLIGIFAAIIADQFTNVETLNILLEFFINNKILIVLTVLFRYLVNYLQFAILKKMEIDVLVGLKITCLIKYLSKKIILLLIHIII